jgi:tyrosyl-tRNA synthetase
VEQLLRSFTFRDVDEIRELCHEHEKSPEKRSAQKVLAEDVTVALHGTDGLRAALDATEMLFGKQFAPLTADQVLAMAGDAPQALLSSEDVLHQSIVDLAVRIGASPSKGESRDSRVKHLFGH